MKYLTTCILFGAFALTGCGLVPPTSNSNVAADIATIQADAEKVCAYLPTASTIAAIINKNDPSLATDTSIASAICQAVTAAPSAVSMSHKTLKVIRRNTIPVYVDGILVNGKFTS
jgi:hypothetical protein